MFQTVESAFERHGVLRAQALNEGINGTIKIMEQLYADYSDGVLKDIVIEQESDSIIIKGGVVIYQGKLYYLEKEFQIQLRQNNKRQILKIRFLEVQNKDGLKNIRILARYDEPIAAPVRVGDVVGEEGLRHLSRHLRQVKKIKDIAFTVVNGENIAGNGLTADQAEDLFAAGVAEGAGFAFTTTFGFVCSVNGNSARADLFCFLYKYKCFLILCLQFSVYNAVLLRNLIRLNDRFVCIGKIVVSARFGRCKIYCP